MPTRQDTPLLWFRHAAPYINAHRGRCFVVHFGGETVDSPEFDGLVHDLALLHSLGIRLVLVHGARPQIEARLRERGIESRYHRDLRITDDTALAAVRAAVGDLRIGIEARLSQGVHNTPMSGARLRCVSGNLVTARPVGVLDGVDLQHTGEVRRIEAEAIHRLLAEGDIVLLSPLGYSPTGEVFNLAAESVAVAAAGALQADKLILLGRTGPLAGPTQLDPGRAAAMARDAGLDEELRRHLDSAVQACRAGVPRVHLVDRQRDGALLEELFTREGAGLLVTAEPWERLRPARIEDVGGILELIEPLEQEGVLVRRSREQLELEIDRFMVLERDGHIIGCAALYPFPDAEAGELACLVVHPEARGQGLAARLLAAIESHARELGLKRLFVLTTRTAHWFRERGFEPMPLEALPVDRQAMYNLQRNSQAYAREVGR
ncbi:MAG: amino-acid N-acetyltransferase [Gammaproteobacteria bacterium]|nr:MAG: amino-acid N-acetyltransferase [Gammaproteobacteria bacterium]